jgi:hypothetical protein
MFEIRLMCEDKKLHKLLWALDGQIVGAPQIIPVRGAIAVKADGRSRVKATGEGFIVDRVIRWLSNNHNAPGLTTSTIKEAVLSVGGAASNYAHIRNGLIKRGAIKKISRGQFVIHNLNQP